MVCVPLGSHLPAPCPGEAVPVPTASLRGPIQSKLVSIESAGVPHTDRALWRGRKAVWVWGPSVMGCEIVIIIIIFHVLAGDRHCPDSFWGQTLRSVSFCGTKSCRLSDLPKVAGLAHGPGLGSVYSIRPCLPGPAQGCSKPRLVNNLLSALEYLRPPPLLSMPVLRGPAGQYDSLPNPFRQECQPCAPWACPIEGMSCQYPFPPPLAL